MLPALVRRIAAAAALVFAAFAASAEGMSVSEGRADAPPRGTVVRLDGEWRFYTADDGAGPLSLPVPGIWNGVQSAVGRGSYVLEIDGLASGTRYALQFKRIDSRALIRVDGVKIGTWGEAGLDFRPKTYWFTASGGRAALRVDVENDIQAFGGIWAPVVFGAAPDVEFAAARDRFFDVLILGGILMMSLYHAAIYLFRRSDRSTLYFSFFCLLVGLKSALTGEQALSFASPLFAGTFGLRLSHLSVVLMPVSFVAYVRCLFPNPRRRAPLWTFALLAALFAVFSLTVPVGFLQKWFFPYHAVVVAATLYVVGLTIGELRRRGPGSLSLLIGILFLFVFVANDMLHDNKIITTFYALGVGMFFFLFFQAVIMGKLYARSYRETRELNESLEKRVAERTAELERLSRVDPLTGLCNRREFMRLLGEAWNRWSRFGQDFCVAMIDLDRFKSINDAYGHAAGDEALRRLCAVLLANVRKTDSVGRYGGEEFCLLLGGTPLADAYSHLEKIRVELAAVPLLAEPAGIFRTISYGVAQASLHRDAAEALETADALMYRAKDAGRNRGFAETMH